MLSAGQARGIGGPPLVETGSAAFVPGDAAFPDGIEQLNGEVTAFGVQITECYFEYGTTTAYGSRTEGYGESCNPGFSLAGDESKAVAGKVLNPSPNTVYHYRLVARNAYGLGIGGDRTFGLTSPETPPKTEPGEESHEAAPAPSNPTPPPASSPSSPADWPSFTGEPGCPTLKLIGVRGSGEKNGLGRPIGAFRRALQKELKWRFAVSSVDYPARIWPWRYAESVEDGVKDLKTQISSDPCSSRTRYILAGYSQGAQVIGDAIEKHRIGFYKGRILTTVFFGDPKFDSRLRGTRFFGSFSRSNPKRGIFGGRPRNTFVGYNLLSFCRRSDPFCQSNMGAVVKKQYAGHEHYQDAEAQEAAHQVALAWQTQ